MTATVVAELRRLAGLDAPERTWLAVAEALLLVARRNNAEAASWADLTGNEIADVSSGVQGRVDALLRDRASSAFAGADDLKAMADIAEQETDLLPPSVDGAFGQALLAHGIAAAVDDRHGATFAAWFRSRVTVNVAHDRAYVVGSHDPRPFLGGHKANTRVSRLPRRALDWSPRLRLGDESTTRYGLVLDFDSFNRASPMAVASPLRMAALQPNLSLAEFDLEAPTGGSRPDHNHGPKDPEAQHGLLVAGLRAAAKEGAQVVVIPEYCLSEGGRSMLAAELDAMGEGRPLIVVGGTTETARDEGAAPWNEAWLAIAGQPGKYQVKTFPAEVAGVSEDISVSSEVRVFWTEGWVIGMVICRDAASGELMEVLARAGVNLLLVPAFSDRTGSLVDTACSLRTDSQGFVCVAVAPAVWSDDSLSARPEGRPKRVEAAFDGPYEHPPTAVLAPDHAHDVPQGRGLWLFDVASRNVWWVATNGSS